MRWSWVAFVNGKSIFRVERVEAFHFAITGDLGQNARCGNAQAEVIPANECRLRARETGNGTPIDERMNRRRAESEKRLAHGLMRGAEDVDAINRCVIPERDRPRDSGRGRDACKKGSAFCRGDFF